jgi:hypothetical protein
LAKINEPLKTTTFRNHVAKLQIIIPNFGWRKDKRVISLCYNFGRNLFKWGGVAKTQVLEVDLKKAHLFRLGLDREGARLSQPHGCLAEEAGVAVCALCDAFFWDVPQTLQTTDNGNIKVCKGGAGQ